MQSITRFRSYLAATLIMLFSTGCATSEQQPVAITGVSAENQLASWNNTENKARIIDFVSRVTNKHHPDYVPPAERFAVFDLDGTLQSEHPYWFVLEFAMHLAREQAPAHPEWNKDPFLAAVIANNPPKTIAVDQWLNLAQLVETGMERAVLRQKAASWLATARDSQGRLFRQRVYQPMVELLNYLRANNFHVWISTGSLDAFAQASAKFFDVPPYQVIGTKRALEFKEENADVSTVTQKAEMQFGNLYDGKVVALEQILGGIRPIITGGNTTNDMPMMTYSSNQSRASLQLLVVHDDGKREALHPGGRILERATERNWVRISMRDDWRVVYPDFD